MQSPRWFCTMIRWANTLTGLPEGRDTKVSAFPQDQYDEAKAEGWAVVSMKNDCKRIFSGQGNAARTSDQNLWLAA